MWDLPENSKRLQEEVLAEPAIQLVQRADLEPSNGLLRNLEDSRGFQKIPWGSVTNIYKFGCIQTALSRSSHSLIWGMILISLHHGRLGWQPAGPCPALHKGTWQLVPAGPLQNLVNGRWVHSVDPLLEELHWLQARIHIIWLRFRYSLFLGSVGDTAHTAAAVALQPMWRLPRLYYPCHWAHVRPSGFFWPSY